MTIVAFFARTADCAIDATRVGRKIVTREPEDAPQRARVWVPGQVTLLIGCVRRLFVCETVAWSASVRTSGRGGQVLSRVTYASAGATCDERRRDDGAACDREHARRRRALDGYRRAVVERGLDLPKTPPGGARCYASPSTFKRPGCRIRRVPCDRLGRCRGPGLPKRPSTVGPKVGPRQRVRGRCEIEVHDRAARHTVWG